MNREIGVQLDPDSGDILITVPETLVKELGWDIKTIIQWTLDQNSQSLLAEPMK